MKIGDVVRYADDWKQDRLWYLNDIYSNDLCQIVIIRNGSHINEKNGEVRLNANITNLNINKICESTENNK